MKKFTHSLVALALAAVLVSFFTLQSSTRLIIYALGFSLGGINDWLDFTLLAFLPHRNKVTHGFCSPLGIILGLIGYILGRVITGVPPLLLGGLFLGYYYLHLILDMRNPSGVYVWGDRKVAGNRKSNDMGINFLYVTLSCLVITFSLFR